MPTIVTGGDPSFAFASGEERLDLREGEPFTLVLELPLSSYSRAVDADAGQVDASRLILTANRDLGDPADGGFAAGENLLPFFVGQGAVTVEQPQDGRVAVRADVDTSGPLAFEVGLWVLQLVALDDGDLEAGPFAVEINLQALNRPTVLARLETPPGGSVPTGRLLPTNSAGNFFIGERLPFALVLEGLPNPETGAGFTRLLEGGVIDPERLFLVADRDLGPFAAGENLARLVATELDFLIDPDTGAFLTGARFALDSAESPPLGEVLFTVSALDDTDVASDPQGALLEVEPVVNLSASVQPMFSAACAFAGCHGGANPTLDLDLEPGDSWTSTVGVRARQTPDTSCALFRVDPYLPEASYLFHKLSGSFDEGCVEGEPGRMPPGGPFWDEEQMRRLVRWILQGAHDN